MPNPFTGLFGRSASTPEADADQAVTTGPAALEAAAAIGGKIATLEASLKAEQEKNTRLTEENEALKTSASASLEALRLEATKAAVIAYGAGSDALAAEEVIIKEASSAPALSALISRYRTQTPAALSGANLGARTTTGTGSGMPVASEERMKKIEEERKKGQEAAELRRKQQDRRAGQGGSK